MKKTLIGLYGVICMALGAALWDTRQSEADLTPLLPLVATSQITNREAVNFANEKIRPMADILSEAYYSSKVLVQDWNARGMGTKITNTTDVISDGASTDGRPPITGIDANNIVNRANEFIADYELLANSKLNTILKVKVNTRTRF